MLLLKFCHIVRVKVDGSGRPWLRNRIQLRPYVPRSPPPLSTTPSSSIVIPEGPPLQTPPAQAPPLQTPTTQIPPRVSTPQPVYASTPNRSERVAPRAVDEDSTWRMSLPSTQHPQATLSTPRTSTRSTQPIPSDSTIPYDMTVHNEIPLPGIRRSTRPRTEPKRLSPKMKGKSHLR